MVDLTKLKKLNIELDKITLEPNKEIVEYMVDGGKCIGFNLLHNLDISIQKAFMPKGTDFPRHSHRATEWLLQISGEAELTIYSNGDIEDIVSMKPGSMCEIPEGKGHSYKVLSNSWLIGITMPGIKAYPGGYIGDE